MTLEVLTWNLKHGRAAPPAGRYLLDEFAGALARWRWSVALLQEVPPWWPAILAPRLDADERLVLTSRNLGLPLRQALATRWPDLIKSNGGGSNAILVRGRRIAAHRCVRLALWPERRWMHGVVLDSGEWIANLHLTVHNDPRAVSEARRAARIAIDWSGGGPLVLGGDFNTRGLVLEGYGLAACHDVDYVFVRGLRARGGAEVLDRGALSDHAPVVVAVE